MKTKHSLSPLVSIGLLIGAVLALPDSATCQESEAYLDAPVIIGGSFERFEHLVDLDDDGDLDLIGVWYQDASAQGVALRSRFNDGSGRFTSGYEFLAPLPPDGLPHLELAQLDTDARPDFVLWSETAVTLLLGQGPVAPQPYGSFTLPAGPKDVLPLDVNADGRDDLITNSSVGEVWINPGGGPWSGPSSTFPLNVDPVLVRFTAVEVNGDGQRDLCFEGVIEGSFQTDLRAVQLRPIVNGAVQTGIKLALPEFIGTVEAFAPGDVDQDGDEDLVCFLSNSQYVLYRRNGPADWLLGNLAPGGPAEVLADFDGDGDLDGLGVRSDAQVGSINGNGCRIQVSLGDGQGGFALGYPIEALGAVRLAGAGDVDKDGDIDLVAGRCLWYAPSLGQLPWRRPIPALSTKPAQLAAIDFSDSDGDQDLDIALGQSQQLRSDSAGNFVPVSRPELALPPGIFALGSSGLPGDFDGDGDPDLLVSAWTSLFGFGHLRLLRNNGAWEFSDGGQATPTGFQAYPGGFIAGFGPNTQFAYRGDLDGDGDIDLAVREAFSSITAPARLLFNAGSGVFTVNQTTPLVQVDDCLDLDGDGQLDLLGRMGSRWYWQPGIAPGSFGAPLELVDALNEFKSFDRALPLDFDGDLDLDLVLQVGDRLALLRQGPAGSFTPDLAIFDSDPISGTPLRLTSSFTVSRYMASGDLDGDGRAEFIVGPLAGGNFGSLVLRFDGQGGFSAVAQAVLASVTDDLDGDGDLDTVADFAVAGRRLPNPGSGERQQYGQGPDALNPPGPVLGANGPLRVGETLRVSVSGLTPGNFGLLALAPASAELVDVPLPGLTALAWPPLALIDLPLASGPGLLVRDGKSGFQVPVGPNWPALGDVFLQAFFIEPSAPGLVADSNGLRLRFAP